MRQSSRLDFPRNPCAAGGHVRPSDIRSKEPVQPRVSKDSHQRSKSIQRDDEISHFYPSFEDQRPAQKYHHAATHSLPPHLDPSPVTSTTGSIGLLNHFPLPPPSRAAFEAERYERRPLPDPQVSSHTRGASKTRIVVNSHATSSSSPHRQHPPHSTSVALSQVDSRESSTHSHAMIHMVSSSSNDSAFSSTSPQQAFSMGTHQHARGVKAGSSKTYNKSDPYHTQKIESSYAVWFGVHSRRCRISYALFFVLIPSPRNTFLPFFLWITCLTLPHLLMMTLIHIYVSVSVTLLFKPINAIP